MIVNRAPIFLFCFSRGGSNIFWNLFLTHPDVCSPILETLEIFRAGLRAPTIRGYFLALMSLQYKLFDQWYLVERRKTAKFVKKYIDKTFYTYKLKTIEHEDMKYKFEDEIYKLEEIEQSRLVTKNNNGIAFLSDMFLEMYPDITFFALVKDPIALYESYRRMRIVKSLEEFCEVYSKISSRMIKDEEKHDNYYIYRFEDIINSPIKTIKQLYSHARLDFNKIKKVRLRAKRHFQADGERKTIFKHGKHYWFNPDKLYDILDPNINKYHIGKIDKYERQKVEELLRDVRERFGYA